MVLTNLGLVAYDTYTILSFCLLNTLHPFVKMQEVDSSAEALSIVLERINSNSNIPQQTKTNILGSEKSLKSKDKGTDYGFQNINYDGFYIDDKKSTYFWLKSNGFNKTNLKDDSDKTRTGQAKHTQRRQSQKYTDNNLYDSTSNFKYEFNTETKLKSSNQQRYHRTYRNAKISTLPTKHTNEFGDSNIYFPEDVKLRIKEKLLDLSNTNLVFEGLSTNILFDNLSYAQKKSDVNKTRNSNRKIRHEMNGIKNNKVLSEKDPLHTWVQHNLQNTTRGKLSRNIRFASWPEQAEFNTLTNNHSDFTAVSDTGLVDRLKTRVRVLCCIMMSTPQKLNQDFHVTAIMDTWGKKCTKVLFMSSNHSFSPAVPVPIVKMNTTGASSSWGRITEAIRYLYQYHLSDADWFLGTDDVSFVIMENLRYMLSDYNPKDPLYFGCHSKSPSSESLVNDTTGYVLSREAVKRFALTSHFKCKWGDDDGSYAINLDQCNQNLLVDVIDTRNFLGRGRFFNYAPEDAISIPGKKIKTPKEKKKIPKKKRRVHTKKKQGLDCCADYAISFHQKDPKDLYVMEYLVYHLRPYGVRFVAANNTSGPVIKIPNQPKQTKDSASVIDTKLNDERDLINADRSVADEMTRSVRVLCWVMTFPDNHQKQAMHVKATWGKRCDTLLFMSTEFDPALPTIALPVQEGYYYLWGKTREAFRYVYEHHREDADWFMKVDDDSYVVVENLRYMLSNYNTTDPMYFGLRFRYKTSSIVGGPGYVLSRAALDKLVTEGLPYPHLCEPSANAAEDFEMALCLGNIGVKLMDSRDSMLRGRFFYYKLSEHYFPQTNINPYYVYYGLPEGLKCCSKYAISFHRISPTQMHVMEYIVYHLKPYGYLWNGTESEKYLSKKLDYKKPDNKNWIGLNG